MRMTKPELTPDPFFCFVLMEVFEKQTHLPLCLICLIDQQNKLSLHTVPCTLNTQDNKVQLTRAFADVCQLHQLRRPCDVVADVVRDHDDVLTDEADRRRRKHL